MKIFRVLIYIVLLSATMSAWSQPFITTWVTSDNEITIPAFSGETYDYSITWTNLTNAGIGDGSTFNQTGEYTITGLENGSTYQVDISGTFPRIYFNGSGNTKIRTIQQWGGIAWTSMEAAFKWCFSLTNNATDAPDLSNVTSLKEMFSAAQSFDADLSSWDVSGITDMTSMFDGASVFNGSIGSWNTSNVTSMEAMFQNAPTFNQNLNSWDVSNVTSMRGMLFGCTAFNGDISSWNTSNVNDMVAIFENATSFNIDIGGWDVSSVQQSGWMFAGATSFNQDLSNWDVRSFLSFNDLFNGASSFDQNLGAWDASNVTSMANMLDNSGMSVNNYDATLLGWATLDPGETAIPGGCAQPSCTSCCVSPFTLGAAGLNYCNDGPRNTLTSTPNDWTIIDAGQSCSPFITTWLTTDGEFTIPTTGTGYDYDVVWTNLTNPGILEGSVTNQTGDYTVTGVQNNATYQVEISGDFPRIYFNFAMEGQDTGKIKSIEQWGNIAWTSMEKAFASCTNLVYNATDAPNLSAVTSLRNMFYSCTSFDGNINNWHVGNITDLFGMFTFASVFNQPLDNWNVSNVTNMEEMFSGASAFNQDLGDWDLSSVTSMGSMLNNAGLSTANYNATLSGWGRLNLGETQIPTGISLGATGLTYTAGGIVGRNALVNNNWDITGDSFSGTAPFITTWVTTDGQITIPTTGAGYNYSVTWTNLTNPGVGEGSVAGQTGDYMITGLQNGSTYQIDITGTFPRIFVNNSGDADKIMTVEQWGDIAWTDMQNAFDGSSNLTINAVDAPDLSIVTNLINMFRSCTSLNSDLNNWDVSNGQNFTGMFEGATLFNGNIVSWTMDNATSIGSMFSNTSFDQPINGWNVANVTDFSFTFNGTPFNQPLDNWNIGAATTLAWMFANNPSFNQDISGWNTTGVTAIDNIFNGASLFNQPLNTWDVSGVTLLSQTFQNAFLFNQPLDNWDVSNVTDFATMFFAASSFDQSLASWDISSATTVSDMLNDAGLSMANYDATLQGWATLDVGETQIPTGLTFGASLISYCAGAGARGDLISTYTWTITDGGFDNSCAFVTTWQTTSDNESITIPTTGTGYNYAVDWGDGNLETGFTGDATHMYATSDTYSVAITGDFPRIYFNNGNEGQHKDKILTIENWGDINWTSFENSFNGCSNITSNTTDVPNLAGVTSLQGMFSNCTAFSGDLSNWDVSTIENFHDMFLDTDFNSDISGWNTGSATNMQGMFANNSSFNQPIGGWNVANVQNMQAMFQSCSAFNQDISSWNVGNVQQFALQFWGAVLFNADVSGWDVSSAISMNSMFESAISFNQSLTSWEVSNVTDFLDMFSGASPFNQSLASWDISSATDMGNMLNNTAMSAPNYDATLSGWEELAGGETQIPINITLGAVSLAYCISESARNDLINTHNWSLVGDSKDCADYLVAYYPFNGGANDESGNGNDGTVNGASLTPDRFGSVDSAYSFDGVSQHIQAPFQVIDNVNDPFTISAWVNWNGDASTQQQIVSWWNGGSQANAFAYLGITLSSGVLQFGDTWGNTGVILPSGRWVHLSALFDGSVARIYLDSDLAASSDPGQNYDLSVGDLYIGRQGVVDGEYFGGDIDDVHVFNRALSASEIDSLYSLDGWPLPSSETDFLTFGFPEQFDVITPDVINHTIDIQVDFGTDFTNLTAEFTLSPGATATIGGTPQVSETTLNDFSAEVTYMVTAEDGTMQAWTVNVTEASNSTTNILDFNVPGQTDLTINTGALSVTSTVAFGTEITNLVATFSLSEGATATVGGVDQVSGVTSNDFSSTLTYVLTAQDGISMENWTVTFVVEPNTQTDFLTFGFTEQITSITPDTSNHTIDITVIQGTSLTALVADFTLSFGATATVNGTARESGMSAIDFTNPVVYTVTAEDGTTMQDWTVTVTEATTASTATAITAFSFADQTGPASIGSDLVEIEVANGTTLSALVATFSLSAGASATVGGIDQVSGATTNDFTNNVTYVVTAQDGITTQNWVVSVSVAGVLSTATEITSFSFTEQTGPATIGSGIVDVEVANGTDLSGLVATFSLSVGATATVGGTAQVSGTTANDFSSDVIYLVTAEDGVTTQNWSVSVPAAIDNQSPTNITLSNNTIAANSEETIVGLLKTEDVDAGDSHTYSLVDGEGGDDNSGFSISGNELIAGAGLTAGTYGVRIQTTDNISSPYSKPFTIKATAVNVLPNDQPYGTSIENYRIIGVPVNQATINSIFSGSYNTDFQLWRYNGSSNSKLSSGSTQLSGGEGYWFIAKDRDVTKATIPTGSPASVNGNGEFELVLRSGWNLIGNPFLDDLDWPAVMTYNGDPTEVVNTGHIFRYNGNPNNYEMSTSINEFEGGWVETNAAVTILIPSTSFSGRTEVVGQSPHRSYVESESDWAVLMKMTSSEHFTSMPGIGMHPEAANGKDSRDVSLPPMIGEGETFIMIDTEADVTKNIVNSSDSYGWTFDLLVSEPAVEISWDLAISQQVKGDLLMYLPGTDEAFDMKKSGSIAVNPSRHHQLKVYFGDGAPRDKLGVQVNAYPNPVSDEVNFEFFVPGDGESREVVVEIMSISGAVIHTLNNSYPSGVWKVLNWKNPEIGSGVYLYRVKVNQKESILRKLIKH